MLSASKDKGENDSLSFKNSPQRSSILNNLDHLIAAMKSLVDLKEEKENQSCLARKNYEEWRTRYWGKDGIYDKLKLKKAYIDDHFGIFIVALTAAHHYFNQVSDQAIQIDADEFKYHEQINKKAKIILNLTRQLLNGFAIFDDQAYMYLANYFRFNNRVIGGLSGQIGFDNMSAAFMHDLLKWLNQVRRYRANVKDELTEARSKSFYCEKLKEISELLISLNSLLDRLQWLIKIDDEFDKIPSQMCEKYDSYDGSFLNCLVYEMSRMKTLKARFMIGYIAEVLKNAESHTQNKDIFEQIKLMADDSVQYDNVNFLIALLDANAVNQISVDEIFAYTKQFRLDVKLGLLSDVEGGVIFSSVAKVLIGKAAAGALHDTRNLEDYKHFFSKMPIPALNKNSLLLEFYDAVINSLSDYILDKLHSAKSAGNTHPWQVSFFAGSARLRTEQETFVVPSVISKIHKLIKSYKSKSIAYEYDEHSLSFAESTLAQISALLHAKAAQEPAVIHAILRKMNVMIGRRTRDDVRQEYAYMEQLTLSRAAPSATL